MNLSRDNTFIFLQLISDNSSVPCLLNRMRYRVLRRNDYAEARTRVYHFIFVLFLFSVHFLLVLIHSFEASFIVPMNLYDSVLSLIAFGRRF